MDRQNLNRVVMSFQQQQAIALSKKKLENNKTRILNANKEYILNANKVSIKAPSSTKYSVTSTKQSFFLLDWIKSFGVPAEIKRSIDGRMVTLEGFKEPLAYYDDPRVHNFGNNSWFSAIMAPAATKLIDVVAYDGVDLRQKIISEIPRE